MKLGNNRARLFLLSALLSLLPAVVQAQFMFITNADNTITITGYTGSNGVVIIPGAIEGLPVTSIGDWAFYSASFNNILIPDSVTKIGDGAFFDSESLTNVTIGSSVAIIGDWTFGFCSSLTTVSCRGDVPSLGGNNVFYGNASTIYYLSDATGWESTFAGHPAVQWNPEVPFNFTTNNGTITITGYTGSDETATIPNKINFLPVTSIGDLVFNENTALTNVVIPDSVTSIGNDAFRFCTHLASVMIPNAVTHIGDFAFDFCEKLSSVTISENVTNLGEYAFYDCSSLTSLTIPDSVTSIKDYTFAQCTGLTNVALGHGVGRIGSTAFQMCVGLTSITIPSCVTTIESGAFIDCTGLTNVTLLNGITSIGNNAFAECSSLTSITIPQSVIWIGIEAFGHCDGLTALVVDANNSFFSSMAGVLFNKSQTLLVAFPGGKAGSYTIPESVTNIGGSAFEYCTKLTNVMIPNHVNSIAERAFLNCTSLNSLTIPQSATYIGSYAFAYCAKLKAIYFKGNIPDFVGPNILLYSPATVYFLPYTTGWNMTFAGRPAVLWNPQAQTNSGSFGLLTNQFGFTVVGSSNLVIMVEASTNLASPVWLPMQTITLTNGSAYFSDPQWPNYSGRFYRLRSP